MVSLPYTRAEIFLLQQETEATCSRGSTSMLHDAYNCIKKNALTNIEMDSFHTI